MPMQRLRSRVLQREFESVMWTLDLLRFVCRVCSLKHYGYTLRDDIYMYVRIRAHTRFHFVVVRVNFEAVGAP
jgi:hypothetical protein